MKKPLCGSLATALIVALLLVSASAAASQAQAATWTPVTSGYFHHHAVDFSDELRGWVGGTTYIPPDRAGFQDTGIIARTDSAGAEWQSVGAHDVGNGGSYRWTFLTVTAIDFLDESRGWATLNDGAIVASVDGGERWVLQAAGSGGYADNNWGYLGLSMAGAEHGVAVGSWVGFIGTTYPRIVYTVNGSDWIEAEFEKPAGFALEAVCMVDAEYGWAVGSATGPVGMPLVMVTRDGGATWTRQTNGLPDSGIGFHGVWFVDRQRGWAVGDKGAIYATADGGLTWWSQDSGTSETLMDVCFAGPTVGYAVGENGVIIETTKSGTPWVLQDSGVTTTLRAVSTADMVVWAVGDEGVILRGSVPSPGPAGTGFSDISSSPYRTAIESLALAGIVNGFADGAFRPDADVKRAQFAKMIVGVLGVVPGDSTATRFTDLGSPDAAGYPHRWVQTAFDLGITYGTNTGGTLFAPWEPIRRDQVAGMIVRGAKRHMTGALEDPPAGTASLFAGLGEPHGENLRIAEHNGLLAGLRGMGAGWSATAQVSRGEAAQLLYNLRAK